MAMQATYRKSLELALDFGTVGDASTREAPHCKLLIHAAKRWPAIGLASSYASAT